MFKYVDKSVELKYETGFHFRVDYLSNNRLRWTSLKERTDGAPMTGEETFYWNQQTDNIFTLSWIEDNGFSVSQNLDFDKMVVYAFMSWNDEKERGGRAILDHCGTIKFIE